MLAVMSLLVCAACGTARNSVSDVKPDYSFAKRPGSGLIVLSTRFSSACERDKHQAIELHYVDDSYTHKSGGVVPVQDWHREPDLQDPAGYFVVRELRAGQHFFYNELVVGGLSNYEIKGLSIRNLTPFTVEEGKATYLGEIQLERTDCGQSVKARLTDQWERDSKLFEARMKNLSSKQVVKKLLTSEPYGRAPWSSN
jgi:hypothetical protein